MTDRPRFRAVDGGGALRVGANGMAYYTTPTGVNIPVEVGREVGALHDDPSFEDDTLVDWSTFWQSGGASVSVEESDFIDGTQAIDVVLPAAGNQILLSSVIAVSAGDVIEHGIWGHKITGSPTLQLGLMSAPSGVPDLLDGISPFPVSEAMPLASNYEQNRRTFTVPAGHTVARLGYIVAAAAAASVRLDLSFSARTGKEQNQTQAGYDSVSLVAQASNFETITFPEAFTAAPVVQVTAANGQYIGSYASVTGSGFQAYVQHRDGTTATISVPISWTATPVT